MKRNHKNAVLVVLCIVLLAVLVALLMVAFGGRSGSPETGGTTTQTTAPSESTAENTTAPTTAPTTVPTTAPYIPEVSPDTVGIYIPAADGTAARKLVTEFSAKRRAKTDIDCFEIIASNDERLEGRSFASIWKAAWDAHEGGEAARIGFHIEFTLTGGETVSRVVLKPGDSKDFYDYLEIYLYDDIHQDGGWYSHLEDQDMKEDTVISSIKLTSGSKIGQVGDIRLTAFIYSGDDCFDADGNYIGSVTQTIVITE